MSDYPTSQPNIPDLEDGVDYIEADDINSVKDEVEAGLAAIGIFGCATSHNTDILAQLMKSNPTIKLSYVDADTLQASAGICKPKNSDSSIRKLRENTSTTNITGADLDAGGPSFAASTRYYVYANGDAAATTVTFVVSTNASAPSGGTNYDLIGGFQTNSSAEVIEGSIYSRAGWRMVAEKYVETDDYETFSSKVIASDDTWPQRGEGARFTDLQLNHAAQKTGNIIVHDVGLSVSAGAGQSGQFCVCLVKDNTAGNVFKAYYGRMAENAAMAVNIKPQWRYAAADANNHTFDIEGASQSSSTVEQNGANGARKGGGAAICFHRITEWEEITGDED